MQVASNNEEIIHGNKLIIVTFILSLMYYCIYHNKDWSMEQYPCFGGAIGEPKTEPGQYAGY